MSKFGGKFGSKKGSGLRVFWLPTSHKSHKNKKNKYYVQDKHDSPRTAMMSGDSPNSHSKDFFDFKEGRTTPPPTTSKDVGIQSSSTSGGTDIKPEIVAASVLVEPPKEHGPGTNTVGIVDGNADRKQDDNAISTEDNKKPSKSDNDYSDTHDRRDPSKEMNGKPDALDGNWIPPSDYKKDDETQDDGCTVKCLYYTMQCCECTIM